MDKLRPIAITSQTLRTQLLPHEQILETQPGVGLYDGKDKDDGRPDGQLVLTSHRLIYIDQADPHHQSCFLELRYIRQTEYWAGFLKSSPKITLLLGEPNRTEDTKDQDHQPIEHWTCAVCGFSNAHDIKCGLCGVPKPHRSMDVRKRNPGSDVSSSPGSDSTAVGEGVARDRAPMEELTCPTCTFLNHPSMSRCEICGSPLSTIHLGSSSTLRSTPTPTSEPLQHSRASTPAPPSGFPANAYIRLSFRRGGEKGFYGALKLALQTKAWGSALVSKHVMVGSGIEGILRSMDSRLLADESEMGEGLKDLEALMAKAKEMVQMAQTLNSKLTALEASSGAAKLGEEESSVTIIRSSLLKLGLPTPAVTADMVASEEAYAIELAKELAGLLIDGRLMEDAKSGQKGMVSLDEVWCIWNRARGVALVSPRDLLMACEHLPAQTTTPQISLASFRSGLKVLHTSHYSLDAFAGRLRKAFESGEGGLTTLEIAQAESLSVALTHELVEMLELRSGEVVRDGDTRSGIRWWPNYFDGYQWSDPNLL